MKLKLTPDRQRLTQQGSYAYLRTYLTNKSKQDNKYIKPGCLESRRES